LYVKNYLSEKTFLSFHFSRKEVKGDHEEMGNHHDRANLCSFGYWTGHGTREGQTRRGSQAGGTSQTGRTG
jgi:hypothetical protein